MSAIFFPPKFTPVSGSGTVFPGAKLSTFEAGSSTAKATYTDSGLTTPYANPVVADANGTFPAIYLSTGAYKFELTTAADVAIPGWPVDRYQNIDGIVNVADYTELRSLTASAGGLAQVTNGGIFGIFVTDGTLGHVSGEDDGGTAIVDNDGALWERRFCGSAFVKWFGGVTGDGIADDTAAILLARDYVVAGPNRTLIFSEVPVAYRLTATVTFNFAGAFGSRILMGAPIRPDAGIGNAFEFIDAEDMALQLYVNGGGQTADYSQADPAGADQAFYIRGVRSAVLDVIGHNYKGRVVRATFEQGGEPKTSRLLFNTFLTGDFGAASCGQAIYADASSAFGSFASANWFWDDYGPVFEDVSDVSFGSLDSGWNAGNNGMELRGVLSFWASSLSLGDETNTVDLLKIKKSATRSSGNLHIGALLLNEGKNGLIVEDVDSTVNQTGLTVDHISSRQNIVKAVTIRDCRGININMDSNLDEVSIELAGASNKNIIVRINALGPRKEAIIVGAGSSQVNFTGAIQNANGSVAANTPAVAINSTGRDIEFESMSIESGNVDFLYKFVAGNAVVLTNGNLVTVGGSTVMGPNPPKVARGVRGYRTRNSGTAAIGSSGSAIAINHGLAGTPTDIQVQGTHDEVSQVTIDTIGATSFIARIITPTTAARTLYWSASLLQSQA